MKDAHHRLELSDVTLTYPDGDSRIVALDRVHLTVDAGELVAVTGPFGSGKSSLLAVAGLLLAPDSGRVTIGGAGSAGVSRAAQTKVRREQIGFVFQQSNLLASLTAQEQLQVVAHVAGRSGPTAKTRARELLAAVGLESVAGRRSHQLSGGQRQRVGIARALMNEPAVQLVDEPTSALDADRGRTVVELLATVTREREVATVMVTHDSAHLGLVDRVAKMHDGRLVAAEPQRKRSASPNGPTTATAGGPWSMAATARTSSSVTASTR